MSGLLRSIVMLLAVGLIASVAHAEGVGAARDSASTQRRIYGVVGVKPIQGGLLAVGGQALRRLRMGSRRWETVHTVPKDSLYRVAADDSGRLLATWENERLIHLFSPDLKHHISFPKPAGPPELGHRFQVTGLEFLPNGRDALVYMAGTVKITTGRFQASGWSTSAYRVALDGKSEPELLFRVDHGYRLHLSRLGAVFAMPITPGQKCDHGGCLIASIVAYELTEHGVRQKTLVDGKAVSMTRARVVSGSDAERVALMLDVSRPKRLGLMRWRYGDAQADFRTVPFPEREELGLFKLSKAGEFIEFRGKEGLMEVWRLAPEGDTLLASLRTLRNIDTQVHGAGELRDGTLWLHWGDHLGLLSPGKPPRSYDLEPLLPRRTAWAGAATYIEAPEEHLWIGIDSAGRHYERVDFATVEKRAKPWPSGAPAERGGAVINPKDPSTRDKLYDTSTLSPMAGGLISIGGKALRRLPTGAARWETLLALPDDYLYRVATDSAGRVLATWEKDPFVHFFDPARNHHLTLPKPAKPPEVRSLFTINRLEFSEDGRAALVFVYGNKDHSYRTMHAVYRIALDGKSAPQQLFRVDDAYPLYASRTGMLFMLPQTPGQECARRTCWPMSAIVAYEFSRDGVRQRTLLRGTDADVSSAELVDGSDDEHVALVLDLIRRNGAQRRNGGRALLRWRWGQDATDYHPLPGHSDITPIWLLTRSNDFIEAKDLMDGTGRLALHRYRPGGAVQTTTYPPLQRGRSMYGLGERGDGGLWLHWGDRLALLPPGRPPRTLDLDPLLPRGFEWAGAHSYVKTPESLWIGLDGRVRNYVRVDLAKAERRSSVWR